MYFRTAGSLIRFSRYDFTLLPLAFFQAVVGLEKTLKLHYRSESEVFKELLKRAVGEGVINDASFASDEPMRRLLVPQPSEQSITCARLFSAYVSSNGFKFYIITEWDRSVTTVLLPEEY